MRTTIIVALLTVLAFATPATAALTTKAAKTVSFADLNLNNESARMTLYRRLESAARDVCGPVNIRLAGSVSRAVEGRACYQEAMDDAVNALGIRAISELHER